jgi:CRP/FNR family cyclic AMP-dependent transcriptional regulator
MLQSDYLKKNKKLVEDLKKIPTLKPFSDRDLYKLLQMSKIKKYTAGDLICKEGAHDSWIYFLTNGKVQIVKKGKQLSVLSERGEVFGEMGAIDCSPRSASVYALETTVCLATDAFYIKKLEGQERIDFGFILYQIFSEILAARLRVTNLELVKARSGFHWGFLKDMQDKFISCFQTKGTEKAKSMPVA